MHPRGATSVTTQTTLEGGIFFFFQLTHDQEESGEIQFGHIFRQSGPGSRGHFHLLYKTVHLAVDGRGRPETLTRLKKVIFTISPSPSVERLARSYA